MQQRQHRQPADVATHAALGENIESLLSTTQRIEKMLIAIDVSPDAVWRETERREAERREALRCDRDAARREASQKVPDAGGVKPPTQNAGGVERFVIASEELPPLEPPLDTGDPCRVSAGNEGGLPLRSSRLAAFDPCGKLDAQDVHEAGGIAEKAAITAQFLLRKQREYNELRQEIVQLQKEVLQQQELNDK